ncbi:MAG: Serine/threonine protein kinase [Actinotalea sp.]|nr:Serine/threonine protein kinase [Actinotalea sp.]
MAPGVDVARGVVLDDRYRLEEVIGQGGMATVYRAHDLVLDRDVAIKLFPPVAEDADDVLRHQAEMRVLAQLSHPGLVTLHDAGSSYAGGPLQQTYLVMELVLGPTLAEQLTQGPLPAPHVALVGRQVAEALVVVHGADVVHRDIKPANVLLVDPQGIAEPEDEETVAGVSTGPIVKLADFGIARLSDGSRLTATGTTLGTATYLSPEQAAGGLVGPATDIYALGLVLLECLTGRKAFTGTIIEVAAARLNTSPAIPSDLGPLWTDLLERMTRRVPSERLTAQEVAFRLAEILQGGPAASEAEEGETLWDRVRREGAKRAPRAPFVRPTWSLSRSPSDAAPADAAAQKGDGTRVYSTAEIQAEADRFVREASGRGTADAVPVRRSRRRTVGALAVTLLVLAGLVLAASRLGDAGRSDVPPIYPSVDGTIGSSLDELQRSVEP